MVLSSSCVATNAIIEGNWDFLFLREKVVEEEEKAEQESWSLMGFEGIERYGVDEGLLVKRDGSEIRQVFAIDEEEGFNMGLVILDIYLFVSCIISISISVSIYEERVEREMEEKGRVWRRGGEWVRIRRRRRSNSSRRRMSEMVQNGLSFFMGFSCGGHSTRGERLTLNWGLRMLGLRDEIKMKLLIRMEMNDFNFIIVRIIKNKK